jgi:hypothetical protein
MYEVVLDPLSGNLRKLVFFDYENGPQK